MGPLLRFTSQHRTEEVRNESKGKPSTDRVAVRETNHSLSSTWILTKTINRDLIHVLVEWDGNELGHNCNEDTVCPCAGMMAAHGPQWMRPIYRWIETDDSWKTKTDRLSHSPILLSPVLLEFGQVGYGINFKFFSTKVSISASSLNKSLITISKVMISLSSLSIRCWYCLRRESDGPCLYEELIGWEFW